MKRTISRILLIILLSGIGAYLCFLLFKGLLSSTVGNWITNHVSIEGKLSGDAVLNVCAAFVTLIIPGIIAILKWCFKKQPNSRLYMVLSCDNDIPSQISSIKTTRDNKKRNTIDISIMKRKRLCKFRYVYAKIKNTGECNIEKCVLAKRQIPCSLSPQEEYKVRFIVPEPRYLLSLKAKRKYAIPYSIEDGMSNVVKGKYKLSINAEINSVDFYQSKVQ